MAGMADNFRDDISDSGLSMRWELLKGYPIEDVEAACKSILLTRKYTKMPPIAEFVEAIQGAKPSLEQEAEQEWTGVIGQIRAVGSYGSPKFDHPVTRALMSHRFSFASFCMMSEKELSFSRKEFIAAFLAEDNGQLKIEYSKARPELKTLSDKLFDKL